MNVTLYHRRPVPGQVSIEAQFDRILRALPETVHARRAVCAFDSRGILRRFYNVLEAIWRQGEVNHITGDVHYLALLLPKRRTVLTVHDCGILRGRSWLPRTLLRWFWFELPARRAGILTAISEQTRRELAAVLGVDAAAIRLIPDCVGEEFTWYPKPFRAGSPEILQIGARPNKNVIRLAQALRGIPCRLRVVGRIDPAARQALRECRIDFINEFDLGPEQIVDRYRNCDLVSFVSTYEGFGVPILEAQATGRPVVTSDLSPLREVAGGGACFVDPYNVADIRRGVLRLIEDPAYRGTVTERGRANAARYRPQSIASEYAAIYAEIGGNEECRRSVISGHNSADISSSGRQVQPRNWSEQG